MFMFSENVVELLLLTLQGESVKRKEMGNAKGWHEFGGGEIGERGR